MITKADIQLIRSLDAKRSRTEQGLFVAEGAKLVEEIAQSTLPIERIFATERYTPNAPHLQHNPHILASLNRIEHVSPKEMERISHLKTATDILALVRIPHYKLSAHELHDRLVIALDGIQDPGNMGTIIRLADWFGIREIICSEDTADCFNPKVVQATMGAITRVRIHYTPLEDYLTAAATTGTPVYGTFLDGETIYNATLSDSGVIVMGNEGRGISESVQRLVNRRLYIPPYPTDDKSSESLNVAIATAIVCSEFRRR